MWGQCNLQPLLKGGLDWEDRLEKKSHPARTPQPSRKKIFATFTQHPKTVETANIKTDVEFMTCMFEHWTCKQKTVGRKLTYVQIK